MGQHSQGKALDHVKSACPGSIMVHFTGILHIHFGQSWPESCIFKVWLVISKTCTGVHSDLWAVDAGRMLCSHTARDSGSWYCCPASSMHHRPSSSGLLSPPIQSQSAKARLDTICQPFLPNRFSAFTNTSCSSCWPLSPCLRSNFTNRGKAILM